jgi:glycolate oxidase FAD binding subunit
VAVRLEGLMKSVASRVTGLLLALKQSPHTLLESVPSEGFWREVGAVAALARFPVIWRLLVPPRQAARIVEQIEPEEFQLDWGGGLIWIGAHQVDAVRVRGALHGGHATLIKASAAERRANAVFEPQAAALVAVAARFKSAFDPDNRLNPGRMS